MVTTETITPGYTSLPRWRVLVAALAVFLLFFQLGTRGLNEPDEGRYAEIGREMAASGDWLVPRLNGVEHLAKPPLTYWLIGLSIRVFGTNEFAARLPAALAALGTLSAIYFLALRGWNDERAALWAVVILLTCLEFTAIARLITTDMILTCFVTSAVCCFWRWYVSTDRAWRKIVWLYAFMGLAMITKGPVGVVLPLFAVLGVGWRNPDFKLRQMRWGKGLIVFFGISLPWFLALTWHKPELWNYFLVRETVQRVASNSLHRSKPFWFFLPVMLVGLWPWTPLIGALTRVPRTTPQQRALVRLCIAWWGLGFLLFTLSKSKLPTYVLPLYGPFAVLAAPLVANVDALAGRAQQLARRYAWVIISVQLVVIVAIAHVAHKKLGLSQPAPMLMALVGAVGALVAIVQVARKGLTAVVATIVGTACAFLLVATASLTNMECQLGRQSSARLIGRRIQSEDPHNDALVLAYRSTVYSLPFYSGHAVVTYFPRGSSDAEEETTSEPAADATSKDKVRVLTDDDVRGLLTGRRRVFCVVGVRLVETVHTLAGRPLSVLEHCGTWTLLSNQPSTP